MPTPPTVYVVDPDLAVCAQIQKALRHPGVMVKTCMSVDGLFGGRSDCASCLILNINAGDELVLNVARRAGTPVVFISASKEVPLIVRAMRAGGMDFLPKPLESTRLVTAVERALRVDAQRLQQARNRERIGDRFATLSSREREVLFAVTDGMLNKQVAFELGLSEKTIKVHRRHVMEKMGADSLPALVRMADMVRLAFEPSAQNDEAAPAAVVQLHVQQQRLTA
jgi:FixJ family two-component response regulator